MIETTGMGPAAGRPARDEARPPTNPTAELLRGLAERLARIEAGLDDVRRVVVERPATKDWYTPDEVAKILGKAKLTVREYCRFGRIHASKRRAGRGLAQEWIISAAEVERIRNEGLLPLRKHVPDGA